MADLPGMFARMIGIFLCILTLGKLTGFVVSYTLDEFILVLLYLNIILEEYI